jgi:hypothetical protein
VEVLQLAVLFFQLPQPIHLAHFKATKPGLRSVERLFADTVLPAQFRRGKTSIRFLQNPYNLLFRVTALPPLGVVLVRVSWPQSVRELATSKWLSYWVSGQRVLSI